MSKAARFLSLVLLSLLNSKGVAAGQIRDGGIDPWNLGKGDWLYSVADATNKLGGHVTSVTNENSLMLFYKTQGIRYMIVKAATSDQLFRACYSFPQFTSNLVNIAHANGILIFGYNRSYGSNVVGEIAIADYVFAQGADGFVFDAEAEWESNQPWIGASGPAKAWQLCSTVRSNWPNKFLAHAPFPIISFHTSFPYKEFGYWCDTVMPQIYHFSSSSIKGSPSAGINWSDVNWFDWQNSLYTFPPTNINGLTVYWTNAIKPLAPINDVYGPRGQSPCEGTTSPNPDKDVMEFIDYLAADPNPQTVGGYQGVSFWRADLHGPVQWAHIKGGSSGNFTGVVNNIVIDNPNATASGAWTSVRTFYNGAYFGNGSGTDTNSFGTNYLTRPQGPGTAFVQFTPNIVAAGNYDVYQWHPFLTNASAGVPFTIVFSGGSTTVFANQTTNAGNWSFLGRFPFDAGTGGTVRVSDNLAESNRVAIVDGMKFVYAGPNPGAPPAAPSDLNASAVSTSRIDLAWSDNATNETGFVVGRSTTQGGPYADIITLSSNIVSHSDTGLAPATTYFYVVRAIKGVAASTNSVEATATTLPLLPTPPVIGQQPQSLAVLPGQSAGFSVTASGTQPLSYQWRFNGSNAPGATATSYSIGSAGPAQAGAYSVLVSNVAGIAISSNAFLAVNIIAAFGDGSAGQLAVPMAASNAVAIGAGSWHSLALRPDGKVVGWGNNVNGQSSAPSNLNDAVAIAAGGFHSLAITAGGTVAAWGANDYHQIEVPAGLTNALAITAGTWHSLALREDGTIVVWGDNTSGQLNVPDDLGPAQAVAAGGNHTLALRADGTVIAWATTQMPTEYLSDNPLCLWAWVSSTRLGREHIIVWW